MSYTIGFSYPNPMPAVQLSRFSPGPHILSEKTDLLTKAYKDAYVFVNAQGNARVHCFVYRQFGGGRAKKEKGKQPLETVVTGRISDSDLGGTSRVGSVTVLSLLQ
ncbi:hypothetical protein SASPL_124073 [Salvia splendens]|uniref:Uncharacterized protein n=1 Tax=Salvia splendens TaxID=180675 RepID=A0A8X8ZUL3_SALSN|nr:hypothetical protein SASPL_124073 [Salvia splendens]